MADVPITALPAGDPSDGTEILPMVQGVTTKRTTTQAVADLASPPPALPAGVMVDYGGTAAPGGWLLCDGSAVDRTVYAALFAAIGIAYGPGDGVSTFNIPDRRGRVSVGAGTGPGLSPRAIGSAFGEEQHQLDTAELASHNHSPLTGGGNFAISDGNTNMGGNGPDWSVSNFLSNDSTTGDTGGNSPHNNMQPSLVSSVIIKT